MLMEGLGRKNRRHSSGVRLCPTNSYGPTYFEMLRVAGEGKAPGYLRRSHRKRSVHEGHLPAKVQGGLGTSSIVFSTRTLVLSFPDYAAFALISSPDDQKVIHVHEISRPVFVSITHLNKKKPGVQ